MEFKLKMLHINEKRGILEVAAMNSNFKYTKNIFLLCEKCVITREVDLVVLRTVNKMTAF